MRIVVLLPTYNEAGSIGSHDMRVLVVDDSSPDGTADIVRKKINQYPGKIHLLLGKKKGLGMAFARGAKYAIKKMKADAIVEMDADFQHDPQDVKRLVAEFDRGYDYVIGSRYIKGGLLPAEWERRRKFLSWAGNIFARLLLLLPNIHDVTSGFKLIRVKGFLDRFDFRKLLSFDYAYKIQVLYEMVKDRRAKVKEIPIQFHLRKQGLSKMDARNILDTLRVVILLALQSRFFKFMVVGTIGFVINAMFLEIFSRLRLFTFIASLFSGLSDTKLAFFSHPSAWAAAASAEVAIISNFTLHNTWTFVKEKITTPARILRKFLQFNITSFGAIVIQFVVVGSAVLIFGDTAITRQLSLVVAVAFFVVPYNYTMYNVVIWKRWYVPWLPFLYTKKSK
jgi:dolichol-phosphate mannosyltransferase